MAKDPTSHTRTRRGAAPRRRATDTPAFAAVLARGPGARSDRHDALLETLSREGAAVFAADPSLPPRAPRQPDATAAIDVMVDDLNDLVETARDKHSASPLVLVGDELGALLSLRVAQRRQEECAALVLWDPSMGADADQVIVEHVANGPSLGPLPTLWIHASPTDDPFGAAIEQIRGDALQEHVYQRTGRALAAAADAALIKVIVVFVQRALRWETMLR